VGDVILPYFEGFGNSQIIFFSRYAGRAQGQPAFAAFLPPEGKPVEKQGPPRNCSQHTSDKA
jgi:hypothetical protein